MCTQYYIRIYMYVSHEYVYMNECSSMERGNDVQVVVPYPLVSPGTVSVLPPSHVGTDCGGSRPRRT